ncbi:MAG: Rne/Rng family ribonuclease [Candidatus Omnitrophica bacterium]|nr:Rne/Rng family ribonuclease [Candidatus Omnitrophota bacterium]
MLKEILINVEELEKRVAILEDSVLEEFYIERTGYQKIVGNIYKGRVESIVPGIQAAFVNIGLEKHGFLYVSDIIEPVVDYEEVIPSNASHRKDDRRGEHLIQNILKKGADVIVQVIKEPIGTKGARLTTQISLPGRYLVLMPTEEKSGISKRIEDVKERERLKGIMKTIGLPKGMGIILRTAMTGHGKREMIRDIRYLLKLWRKIKINSEKQSAPSLVHEEYDLMLRIVRDYFTEEVGKLIIDSKDEIVKVVHFINSLAPHLKNRIELHHGQGALFEKYNIERDIEKIYERKIFLKSGGHIVIEPTESLIAIDVNTGRFVGRRSLEETVLHTNLEAAKEIARQLKLRDLGGIIVIDFIDMENPGNRTKVFNVIEDALKSDRAKTNLMPFSNFGTVEMTRQRMRQSLESVSYEDCWYCEGRGKVKSQITMSILALRQVKKYLKDTGKKAAEVSVHPNIASRILNEDREHLRSLENIFGAKIMVRPDINCHIEDIKIIDKHPVT